MKATQILHAFANPAAAVLITTVIYASLLLAYPAIGKTLIAVIIAFVAGNLVVKLFARKDAAGIPLLRITRKRGYVYLIYFLTIVAATAASAWLTASAERSLPATTTPANALVAGLFFSLLVFTELHFR